VFNISLQAGITELGRMPFAAADAGASSGATCSTWWSDSTSLVKRSIFMDEYAYRISDTQLKVAPFPISMVCFRA
jgi:hypothetical protein